MKKGLKTVSTYSKEVIKAYELAKEVRQNAHAPYSHFLVGACLKIDGQDEFITGCNVENVSYGATICAERNAFTAMIARFKKVTPEFIVVVTDTEPATMPCALCLQVMAEFCEKDFVIYMANLKGIDRKASFEELLPTPFQKFEVKN